MTTVLLRAVLPASALAAQGLTVGGLTASIVDEHGAAMRDVTVTLERAGSAIRTVTTDRLGAVAFGVLAPGRYAVLAEEFGYQPVRMRDVLVMSASTSHVTLRLTRRPPPITSVEEQPSNVTLVGAPSGLAATGADVTRFDRRFDISGVPAMFSEVNAPSDGRDGFVASANGLRPGFSSLLVDGVREALLRHPGLPDEPASAPLFARDGVDHVGYVGYGPDVEWPGTLGAILDAQSRRGSERFTIQPWASYSGAKLGGRAADNPGDSSAMSVQGGVAMGGPIKHDTASWFVRADYQQLRQPAATPFEPGLSTSDTVPDLAGAVRLAAESLGRADVSRWLAPPVRTWQGGSGSGRLDWSFGPNTLFAVRVGAAGWSEDNPQAGLEPVNGAGSHLKAYDISGAATLTTGSELWTSDTRLGAHVSNRDWTGATLPFTELTGDAVAIGGAVTLPGSFRETAVDVAETFALHLGDHTLKAGGALLHRQVRYDWLPGSAGRFLFGDLPSFATGTGAFYQTIGTAPVPDISINDLSGLVEDSWQATPTVRLFGGVRLDRETLPASAIAFNTAWGLAAGVKNNLLPGTTKRGGFGPKAGFFWDPSGSGATTLRGDFGLVPGQYDLAAFAEAAQFDGGVDVRRATGALVWPQVGAAAGSNAGQALTLFGPDVRLPRATDMDLSLSQRIAASTIVTAGVAYRHDDYLLQRVDLNRVEGDVATASDGRPIFGTLQQYGGLVTAAVGSNRRFQEFDFVYGLGSTGYNDYYEASVSLERRLSRHFGALLSYTYSRTTDNLPGELSADPADRLTPFPNGLNGVRWENARSDFDLPHRVAATLTYAVPAPVGLSLATRFRYRSGLPFTPGFRSGVDANGDGSVNNDPAFLGSSIPGMTGLSAANACLASQGAAIAARNSCRDPGVYTLDLHAAITIAHGWALTLDGFGVIGSTTGLYDHAAVLVNPRGSITTDASGHTVLPLIANPSFGQLLSRRGDPRIIRIGIRMEDW
ncbi:MAG TPA: carboxypeptidase regulatory-like domain-containing protein [Gemmatimonadales bacterium]